MKITIERLQEILLNHKRWADGAGGERANLRDADLRGANLMDADLAGANLMDADLAGANLMDADLAGANLAGANIREAYLTDASLTGADLTGADLTGAYLRDADLRGAYLTGASLREADLTGAYLRGANLRGANLRGASLREANLTGASLRDADLMDADLRDAYLRDAYLRDANGAELAKAQTVVAPPEGEVIGWKKCCDAVIVKLRIPAEAKRSNASGRKCRAEFVDVLDVIGADCGFSKYDGGATKYVKGETVRCHGWDDNRWEECSGGIHFFITREEAEAYE